MANSQLPSFLLTALRPARRLADRVLDRKGLRRAKSRLRQIAKMKQDLVPGMEIRIDGQGQVFLHEPGSRLDYFFPLHAEDLIKVGNYAGFEERERSLVSAILGDSGTLVDIGANVGVFSMSAAMARPAAKIFAVEPVRDNFEVCRINLERNELQGRVKLWQLALGEKKATVEIPTGVGTWQFISSAAEKSHSAGMKVQPVEQVTLDSFVAEKVAGPVSMIKCDVEGYELFVLKGALETLRKSKPALLLEISRPFCERFNYKPEDIFTLLAPLGYSYLQLMGDGKSRLGKLSDRDVDFAGANFLFFPEERAAEFRAYTGA
jgi:FkbM family methyltransferase